MILFLTDLDILQNRPVTSQATSLWGSPWMCPRTKASHNKVHHKGSGRWKYWAKCKEGLSRECARERAGYPQGDWESNHTGYILACVDVIYILKLDSWFSGDKDGWREAEEMLAYLCSKLFKQHPGATIARYCCNTTKKVSSMTLQHTTACKILQ